jgi:hypothetical protein
MGGGDSGALEETGSNTALKQRERYTFHHGLGAAKKTQLLKHGYPGKIN